MPASPAAFCPPSVALSRPRAGAEPVVAAPAAATFLDAAARRWFLLAIGSLVVAGLLSISVVFGRLPGIARFIDDPLFFKRCLVVHVDLALVVWFYAFIAALNALSARPRRGIGGAGFVLAVAGVGAMLAGALMRGAQPILANYVPVIDHPLFLAGLGAFFVGTLVFLLETLGAQTRLAPGAPPADSATGLQAAAGPLPLRPRRGWRRGPACRRGWRPGPGLSFRPGGRATCCRWRMPRPCSRSGSGWSPGSRGCRCSGRAAPASSSSRCWRRTSPCRCSPPAAPSTRFTTRAPRS